MGEKERTLRGERTETRGPRPTPSVILEYVWSRVFHRTLECLGSGSGSRGARVCVQGRKVSVSRYSRSLGPRDETTVEGGRGNKVGVVEETSEGKNRGKDESQGDRDRSDLTPTSGGGWGPRLVEGVVVHRRKSHWNRSLN